MWLAKVVCVSMCVWVCLGGGGGADSRLLLLLSQTYGAWDQAVWLAVVVAGHLGVWVDGGGGGGRRGGRGADS